MIKEEASFILANIDRRVCDDELSEALDIAIEALETELCEDVISKTEVRKFVEYVQSIKDDHNENQTPINYGTICDIVIKGWNLLKLPPVNPQPKTGHWIEHEGWNDDTYSTEYSCSECNEWIHEKSNFCPNCGAKMVGK